MYVVKNSDGETVLMASRLEDAQDFVRTELDNTKYSIYDVNVDSVLKGENDGSGTA